MTSQSTLKKDSEATKPYDYLSNAICINPKHNALLVISDCNAYLGLEDALYTFHERIKPTENLPLIILRT